MPSINKHTIAPLNLSTTVEGSLVGLRESLVTLSAALESQGRRLELALTTEGLRVSEEVGSLKAIVQGLRMQVSLCVILWFISVPRRAGICYSDRVFSIRHGTPTFACRFTQRRYPRSPPVKVLYVCARANHFVLHATRIGLAIWCRLWFSRFCYLSCPVTSYLYFFQARLPLNVWCA